MPHALPVNDAWTLQGTSALLCCGALSARVDVSRPEFGMRAIQFQGAPLSGQLWSVANDTDTWPAAVGDAYVRGPDLVASYKASVAWPYAPQIYWSAGAGKCRGTTLAELSLLVSIQTPLLDTHPRINITSHMHAEEVLCLHPAGGEDLRVESLSEGTHTSSSAESATCVLWRLNDRSFSYLETATANDFRELRVRVLPMGECESRWQLFAEFLEKGVIRRVRVHGAFLPRENDVQLAADYCRSIERRPLPLTT